MDGRLFFLYRYYWDWIDLLIDPQCGGCRQTGFRWCESCHEAAHLLTYPVCEMCGNPDTPSGACERCQARPPHFDAVRSWAVFEDPLRRAIVHLKHHKDGAIGLALAEPLVGLVRQQKWAFDLVLPVPLSPQRARKRGYNQVSLLAYPLAAHFRAAFAPRALQRIRETRTQVGLTHRERRLNLVGAFRAAPNRVAGRNVLLVDDVFTTGSTLEESARALKQAGAHRVFAVTLARALPRRGSMSW